MTKLAVIKILEYSTCFLMGLTLPRIGYFVDTWEFWIVIILFLGYGAICSYRAKLEFKN